MINLEDGQQQSFATVGKTSTEQSYTIYAGFSPKGNYILGRRPEGGGERFAIFDKSMQIVQSFVVDFSRLLSPKSHMAFGPGWLEDESGIYLDAVGLQEPNIHLFKYDLAKHEFKEVAQAHYPLLQSTWSTDYNGLNRFVVSPTGTEVAFNVDASTTQGDHYIGVNVMTLSGNLYLFTATFSAYNPIWMPDPT